MLEFPQDAISTAQKKVEKNFNVGLCIGELSMSLLWLSQAGGMSQKITLLWMVIVNGMKSYDYSADRATFH